uniref:Uncharacterized protein n=1 Tax=Fagus sylvatica TaxID=28930 RepID=A0A2N9H4M3_FAGSY
MGTNFLQPFPSKSPPSSTTFISTKPFITITHTQIFLPSRQRQFRIISPIHSTDTSSSNNNNNTSGDSAQPPAPPEIRFRRRSRRRSRQLEEDGGGSDQAMKAKASDPPKKWEDMSVAEKAIELYVGEKGLLFWLNKFAYASIFIVIGGWILFRFVGPSLNLYQLDSTPLPPTAVFKGS